MLQALPIPLDVFNEISAKYLVLTDLHALKHVNRELHNAILFGNNTFWKSLFENELEHLTNTITIGEPQSWYLTYEKGYCYDYKINLYKEKKKQKKAYRKAALFTAAKNGN